jgi:hypothetical protein
MKTNIPSARIVKVLPNGIVESVTPVLPETRPSVFTTTTLPTKVTK